VRLQLTVGGHTHKACPPPVPEAVACASGCRLDELAALTTRLKSLRDQVVQATAR
jgi:MarR family transcriptional regulator, organic hydroperoxide resistance regulator